MKVLHSLYLLPAALALGATAAAQTADVASVAPTGNNGFASHQPQVFGGAPKAVLFTNGTYITQTGVGAGGADVSEIEPGLTLLGAGHQQALGYRVADDFDVPAGATWTLSTVKWLAYQTNAPTTGTINEITTEYLDGSPSGGGLPVAGDLTTNRLVSTVWTGVYRVTSTTLTSAGRAIIEVTADAGFVGGLGAGNYWLSAACGGTSSSGPWAPPTVPWDSTDNGEQFTSAWAPLTQGFGGTPIDFPYVLEGSSAGGGPAVSINEIYASHSGTDDKEMIELIGDAGASLDGVMVLVVEGDAGGSLGTLDRAWDLAGFAVRPSGYFVLGDDGVVNQNFSIGTSNAIENGTDTFYLVHTSDTAAISALLGTVVDIGGGATVIPSLATIIDIVGMVDGGFGTGDMIYDGAQAVGPDGTFLPAGIFRGMDSPNGWCPDSFLDFDPIANANEMRTPGTQNVNCNSEINGYCVAQVNSDGCTPVVTTVGAPSASAGSGFTIDGSQLMPASYAMLAYSTVGADAMPFGGGTLCLAPAVSRTSVQLTGGAGACSGTTTMDFNAFIAGGSDPALVAGQDVFAQYWSRDEGDAIGSNLSSALAFNIGS